jgi:hypothetical protein
MLISLVTQVDSALQLLRDLKQANVDAQDRNLLY